MSAYKPLPDVPYEVQPQPQPQPRHSVDTNASRSETKFSTRLDEAYYQPSPSKFWTIAFFKDTVADLKKIQWRLQWSKNGGKIILHIFFACWIVFLLVFTVILPTIIKKLSDNYCQPDGSFSVTKDIYQYFTASAAFVVNIGFGSFTFSQVKLIDIAWDVLVGRGGQAICGLVAYNVMTGAITRLMESESVSRQEFEATVIHNTSFIALTIYAKYLFRRKPLRATLLTLLLFLNCVFVLSVPTWAGAMTGYKVKVDPYMRNSAGNLIKLYSGNFKYVYYIIHDGSRLGPPYSDNHPIAATYSLSHLPIDGKFPRIDPFSLCSQSGSIEEGALLCAVSNYTSVYGFRGLMEDRSRFKGISLLPPVLNISAHMDTPAIPRTNSRYDEYSRHFESLPPKDFPYGLSWVDPTTGSRPYLESPEPRQLIGNDILTYKDDDLNRNGLCSAGSSGDVQYQWGFSAILLEGFLATLLVWSIFLYSTYLDAFLNSRLVASGREMGSVRAALDMSHAIATRLEFTEGHVQLLSDRQLKQAIRDVRFDYSAIVEEHSDLRTRGFVVKQRWHKKKQRWNKKNIVTWMRREKIWLALALILIIIASAIAPFFLFWPFTFLIGPIVGIGVILALGPARRSRWLVFCCSLLANIIPLWVLQMRGV